MLTERIFCSVGNPISILDGIFVAIKDDIDLHPYLTNGSKPESRSVSKLFFFLLYDNQIFITRFFFTLPGGTTWMHEVSSIQKDAVCVAKLRSCGVIFVGKANMHEVGMGTTGNNPNYG